MKETFRTIHLHKWSTVSRKLFTANRQLYTAPLLRLALIAALPLLMLAACVSPSERQRMETMLADYEQRNSQYDTLSIDSTRRLADFFSRHGDAHQRMRAYYLLGCAHETAGESPQALDMFYKSLEQADTTASDCDYKRLSRIHGQMAQLLIKQHVLAQALNEIEKIDRYAFLAKDTLMRLINLEQKGHVLRMQGKKDSAFLVSERTVKLFNDCGMKLQAVRASGPIIGYLLEHGKLSEAKRLMDVYEKESGFFNDTHMTLLKNKTYYYYRGNYYLQTEQLDSAAYFFRKEIREAGITNNLETGYLGLCRYFQKKHMPDSAVKYALLSREMNDSCYNELSTDYYQRMQASFNYSRAEKKAAMLEKRDIRIRSLYHLMVALLIITVLVGYLLFTKHKKTLEDTRKDMLEWREKYAQILKLKEEITIISNSEKKDFQEIIEEKKEEIAHLEKRIKDLQKNKQLADISEIEEALVNAPVVHLYKKSLVDKNIIIGFEEWNQMGQHMNNVLPSFMQTVRKLNPDMSDMEQRVCILVRLHFPLKDIASIEKISLQHLGILRKRLLKKMFGIEGSAKDFDKNIIKIL